MTGTTQAGIARWLAAAIVSPVVAFFVANGLPIGDAPNSSDGIAYLIASAFHLALFAVVYELVCPWLLAGMATSSRVSLLCGLAVGACVSVRYYFRIAPGDEAPSSLALASLRNEVVATVIAIALFIFLGLKQNPVFDRCRLAFIARVRMR